MPDLTPTTALQLILALSLLNVWILRSGSATGFRGKDARSLREEFAAYGLPRWVFLSVGALKLGAAAALIAAYWFPELLAPTAALLVALMCCAIVMHVRVKDAAIKSLPAALMLAMSVTLFALRTA